MAAPRSPGKGKFFKRKRVFRRAEPEPIEAILDRAGEQRHAGRLLPVGFGAWRRAVGPKIADRALPAALEKGVLTILVANSAWAQELSLLQRDLSARLEKENVVVREFRFRVGPVETFLLPPERRIARVVPPPAPLPSDLEENLSHVADETLRALIAESASANLAWQEYVARPAAEKKK